MSYHDEEDASSGWNLLESDPLVFTSLLRDIGVKGLQVDDIYSLDPDTLRSLEPIHALIFLFKWVAQPQKASAASDDPVSANKVNGGELVTDEDDHLGVYFANQVVNNACGTIASLNAVMNIPPSPGDAAHSIDLGPELSNLREFGLGMSSMDLGHLITNSDVIRQVHNSFSTSSPFSIAQDPRLQRPDEDAYHFVTYVPAQGCLWELDGLTPGPIRHGPVSHGPGKWIDRAREVVQARIASYPPGSLMFSLLCIRSEALPHLRARLADPATSEYEKAVIQEQIAGEEAKIRRGQLENGLRRANLIPMAIELLRVLAKEGKLSAATENARDIGRQRKAKNGED